MLVQNTYTPLLEINKVDAIQLYIFGTKRGQTMR